jgi:hypothetical protein
MSQLVNCCTCAWHWMCGWGRCCGRACISLLHRQDPRRSAALDVCQSMYLCVKVQVVICEGEHRLCVKAYRLCVKFLSWYLLCKNSCCYLWGRAQVVCKSSQIACKSSGCYLWGRAQISVIIKMSLASAVWTHKHAGLSAYASAYRTSNFRMCCSSGCIQEHEVEIYWQMYFLYKSFARKKVEARAAEHLRDSCGPQICCIHKYKYPYIRACTHTYTYNTHTHTQKHTHNQHTDKSRYHKAQ